MSVTASIGLQTVRSLTRCRSRMSALPSCICFSSGVGRRAVEIDARDGGLRALEDDVLGFLHVDFAARAVIEHVRQHAGTVAVPDDQHVRRRRLLGQVDDVRHLAGVLVRGDDAHGLGGDGFLRLVGRRADVMRAVDARQRQQRVA